MIHTENTTTTKVGPCMATVIADTRPGFDTRLTTFELVYPRIVHGEFLTHRAFSRNASSSRATPVSTMIDEVMANPYVPTVWRHAQKGMKPGDRVTKDEADWLNDRWIAARNSAVATAKTFETVHVAKEHVNRLLEPFSYIRVLCTATDWSNFFKLRTASDAQYEMQCLALAMHGALRASKPINATAHLPYLSAEERQHPKRFRISAARCARVSYLTHNGKPPSIDADLELAETLLASHHMSPFEHPAVASTFPDKYYANFKGWISVRYDIENPQK